MGKYLKYFISTLILIISIFTIFNGTHFPTLFFICFSLVIMLGDYFLKHDTSLEEYKYPVVINLPIYINLFLLLIQLSGVIFILGSYNANWLITFFNSLLSIDLIHSKNTISLFDKISLVSLTSLFMGIMGTVPGHELTHRKKNKFDMFFGNWLLALSWDCSFAIEHVYGHHKNVGLNSDPATAKRGENLYLFIFRAILKEQLDAWKIECQYLEKRNYNILSIHNKVIIGYIRSLMISIATFSIGGLKGLAFYILCAFIAKALLEVINYTEHYGLVRAPGHPVSKRHSWNSNSVLSSILLYNVTRHSAHHEKTNLKFWELNSYIKAPMMPQGYLTMLYLAIFLPVTYQSIMKNKLSDWNDNDASKEEKEIIQKQILINR